MSGSTKNLSVASSKRKQMLGTSMSDFDYKKIQECISNLDNYDDVMAQWLNASKENRELFFQDPVTTFKKIANPGEDTMALLDSLQSVDTTKMSTFYHTYMKQNDKEKPVLRGISNALTSNVNSAISTNGWDIVASARVDEINKILKWAFEKDKLPDSFTYETDVPLLMFNVHMKTTIELDIPQIVGGTGTTLEVCFPIKKGTVEGNVGESMSMGPWEFGNKGKLTTVTLKVNLQSVETTREDGTKKYEFYMVFGDSFIDSVSVANLSEEMCKAIGMVIDDIMLSSLKKVLDNRKICICEVSLDSVKGFEYLVPSYARYIFTQKENFGSSPLSILALTVSEKNNNLNYVVDSDIIPEKSNASVLIDDKLFMNYILLPSLNKQYEGNIFAIKENKEKGYFIIYNTKSFEIAKVEGYTPEVKNFTISIYDGTLNINTDVEVTPTSGITLKYNANGSYTLKFVKDSDGTQKLELVEKEYHSDHDVEVADWVWIVAAVAAIAGIFIGAIGIAVAGGISESIVAIVAHIVDTKAPNGIEPEIFTKLGETVKWGHADLVEFTNVILGDGVDLGLNLTFLK